MEKYVPTTYCQKIAHPMLFNLAKEAGEIYSAALQGYSELKAKNGKSPTSNQLEKFILGKIPRQYLHSMSSQALSQLVVQNFSAYWQAIRAFSKNPIKFTGPPKPPHKSKFFGIIIFKQSAIRLKNKKLMLSLAKGLPPIEIPWALECPYHAKITYSRTTGWSVHFVLKRKVNLAELIPHKFMAIDLGVKRIASTCIDENSPIKMYMGKYMMSLVQKENKIRARFQSKESKYEKNTRFYKQGSRKQKRIARAKRRVLRKIKNQKRDYLHKTSREIVNDAVENKVQTIVFGNCAGIHHNVVPGNSKDRQKIQQNPEQQLKKYISNKFENVGGITEVISEEYTSQECPCCGARHHASNRSYKCTSCGFSYDRDGVGAININQKYRLLRGIPEMNVVGCLTPPVGIKYRYCPQYRFRKEPDARITTLLPEEALVRVGTPRF